MTFAVSPIRLLAIAMLFVCAGCEKPYRTVLPTVKLQLGDRSYTLEVADSDETRTTGLMRRDFMPDDHGMIFVFNREQNLAFWMKNTRIPLDIVYLDQGGRIVSIKSMKPHAIDSTPTDAPAQYAIELNKGQADAAGLKTGMKVNLPALSAKD